jgi:hypothetical protein
MYYNEADLTLIRPHSDENKQKILPLMALIYQCGKAMCGHQSDSLILITHSTQDRYYQ